MKLYHSTSSPNSRRVRILLAEKGLTPTLIPVDLGTGEQHGDAYRAINPRRVVPTLVLDDGTTIGEVPVISRYLDDVYPTPSLFGTTPAEQAVVSMWDRRIEQEGFASVMEAIRNKAPGLKGRAIAGPHDYEQIPALVERSTRRVKNLFADVNARLAESPFAAGENFSVADITLLVTVDFAAKAIDLSIPEEFHALRRWYDAVSLRGSAAA
ncbi:MAG: glutathione S-transferase family protein [Burkholderia contaminans]|jgi:glutathione S-transferase|uniref:Glutathione S-transferase n=1 Tax=Burkholderia contaminans TaxID=488447 RepID=A0AAP4QZN4_9BURK|nr:MULTISPECIES: glutathione S-transferase [Burkholderia]MBD1410619.1 glutathione S-transferase [Burkholderia contaminans]MBH9668060.1 glutathione S-transferase [Burkholderia contaminans]MBH9678227.1 glutathione S-transferase [Burkholderia contaminans]MBH9705344.1 glutathione S-transferase [Burkholderia contaminans]MBH9721850.1 glutathione S-transferase [Burkholderia contaminans]